MPAFVVRKATVADIEALAGHRAAMFRDMGDLAPDREAALAGATATYLRDALPRGEYLAWVAESAGEPEIIAGAGAQLRPILPRPGSTERELELGPEAIILNVYVQRKWRRQGIAEALMRELLDDLAGRGIRRIVLHASPDGRRLYERMGFEATNEMRLRSQ